MPSQVDVFRALQEPFPVKFLSWKIITTNKDKTDALVIPYVGARHIMERLDSVLGPINWQTGLQGQDGYVVKGIAIRIGKSKEWVWRWEPGVYEATRGSNKKQVEILGSSTVGFRRAAMEWGIGRYLWFLDGMWTRYDEATRKLREKPSIENINFWWALPYNHPAAKEKWLAKNGETIVELGTDDDAADIEDADTEPKETKDPKVGADPIDIDEYFSTDEKGEKVEPEQKYTYGDFRQMAVAMLNWTDKQAREYLEKNKATMTPDEMVEDLERARKKGVELKQEA